MSRRKRDAQLNPPAAANALTPGDAGRFRRRLLVAGGVTAVWWAALIALVVFTANPVTFNRRQLDNSEHVVTAEILDAAEGQVKIVKHWKGSGLRGKLRIIGLSEFGVRDGKSYVLPLSQTDRGGWRITPAPDSPREKTVYPATDDALRQLDEVLNAAKATGR